MNKVKISILLPYKENFHLIILGPFQYTLMTQQEIVNLKKNIIIYGSTNYKNKLSKNYVNLPFKREFLKSSSKIYVQNFLYQEKKRKSDLIEIHNRPSYVDTIFDNSNAKLVLYFHNDPLDMNGSKSKDERMNLFNKTKK